MKILFTLSELSYFASATVSVLSNVFVFGTPLSNACYVLNLLNLFFCFLVLLCGDLFTINPFTFTSKKSLYYSITVFFIGMQVMPCFKSSITENYLGDEAQLIFKIGLPLMLLFSTIPARIVLRKTKHKIHQ